MDSEETLAAAQAHHRAGRFSEAFALCATLIGREPDNAGVLHLAGVLAHQINRNDIALALVERAAALEPGSAEVHNSLGIVLTAGNELARAETACRRAVARAPDDPRFLCNLGLVLCRLARHDEAAAVFRRALVLDPASARSPAQSGLAQALFPGDDYRAMLKAFHQHLRPAAYVEIGVSTGASLRLAGPATRAIGVDPAPRLDGEPLAASARLFPVTSDAFFAGHDLCAELGGIPFDLAFIDGLHTFDQALRDFINLERNGVKTGIVLFHDVLPADEMAASRACRSALWAGDTWKIVPILRRYRPDLRLFLIPAAPTGLAAVTGLDPASTVLDQAFAEIVAAYLPMGFADYRDQEADRRPLLVANQWDAVAGQLRSAAGPD